jgi:hypothetical protein
VNPHRVFISGEGAICNADPPLPVICHMKADGYLGDCGLKDLPGGAAKAILSAVGHNFRSNLVSAS